MVITEAAQHYVSPASTLETVVGHANTGAIWGLGFQLVAMLGTGVYKALPSDGSFTVSWRVHNRGDSSASLKDDPAPRPTSSAASEARVTGPVSENEKHGV
ncbi:hypothetical protein JK361_35255 [Streptomyces sp. 5-8]|uniref:Uncharacterized protein n=1 Tax=Streptomyces musisoli TaxID=2802280 RepID=A0ABS1PBL1_9ACTN|nr:MULTISPECIES: hypothetical protein [Streptomyces]MBL1109771.1 hypothetical protein [Streptomyces musisoli]MBY8846742.1 hypothetical protein [Streptomyces sp. SP2-10]